MKLLTLTFVTLVLTFGVCENYFRSTTELIENIYDTSSAESICFVCDDSKLLSLFLETHPSLIFQPQSVNISWNGSGRLYGHVLLLVEAVSKDPNDIEVLHGLILQFRIRNFAIVIAADLDTLRQYFSYLWKNEFRRIFGIVNGTFFAYFPYADPTEAVHRFVGLNPLPNGLMNLNGHPIRTAIKLDVPRSFWYTDKDGVRKVGGFVAQILMNFLEKINATFVDGLKDNQEKQKEIVAVINGELDVSLNPYIPNEGIRPSYPVKLSRWTIMVPLRGFLDPNEYFLRPFTLTLWGCIGLTCLYIILMHVLMNILLGQPANVWHSFTQTYLTMLNMSLELTYPSAYRFQLLQKIFAFIVVNFYLVFLTSFLTVFIKVKEYDSLRELIDDKVPVMLGKYDWKYTDHAIFPKDFEKVLVTVPSEEIVKARYSMHNTSFAYGVGIDAFSFLESLVSRYSKPKFKLISASLNQALYTFLWSQHAPLQDLMGEFIIRISDYGIVLKWTRDSVMQGANIVKKFMNIKRESSDILFPLTVKQLRFAWNCLFSGLTAAFVVFLAERISVTWCKSSVFKRLRTKKRT